VAAKALENDEITIKHLRKDLLEAQQKSEEAASKQVIAADLIQALRLEIMQLNRRMKDQMSTEDVTHSIPQSAIYQEADNQVEQMMFKKGIQFKSSSIMGPPDLQVKHVQEPLGVNRPSDFQEWKMKKFLWAPDTPAGSENHDTAVVSELLQATFHPPDGTGILRKNTSTIAKQRIHGFKYSEDQIKSPKSKTKTLPTVKATSKKHKNKTNLAQTMNDEAFLKEFKDATMSNYKNERPRTTQRF
jgi:hypothetical protein